jgi:hypothetical protein
MFSNHFNQCIFYLNIESIINIVALVYSFIDRITPYSDGHDLADYSLSWCKMRIVLDQMMQFIPISIICFATFDQIFSTNH